MIEVKMNNVIVCDAQYLFTPAAYYDDVKYKLEINIPKDNKDLPKLTAALVKEIRAKFSSTVGLTNPLIDCDKPGVSLSYWFQKNSYRLMLKSKYQPRVTTLAGKRIAETDNLIVPGCLVNVSLKIHAYNIDGNKIISRYLNSVTYVKAGQQAVQSTVTSSLGTGATLNSTDELSWTTSPAPDDDFLY